MITKQKILCKNLTFHQYFSSILKFFQSIINQTNLSTFRLKLQPTTIHFFTLKTTKNLIEIFVFKILFTCVYCYYIFSLRLCCFIRESRNDVIFCGFYSLKITSCLVRLAGQRNRAKYYKILYEKIIKYNIHHCTYILDNVFC